MAGHPREAQTATAWACLALPEGGPKAGKVPGPRSRCRRPQMCEQGPEPCAASLRAGTHLRPRLLSPGLGAHCSLHRTVLREAGTAQLSARGSMHPVAKPLPVAFCVPASLPNTLLQGRSDKPPPSRMPVSPPQQRLGYFVALALSRAHSSRVTTPTFLPHTAPPWLLLQCGVCCVPDYFDFLHKHLFTH